MEELITDHDVYMVRKIYSKVSEIQVLDIVENGKRRILIKEKKK